MPNSLRQFLLLLLGTAYLSAAELHVDASRVLRPVSPDWFGIFFEEINHAGDGGIMAELVRNGSFSEAATLTAWSKVSGETARVNLFFDEESPLSLAKTRSLRAEIDTPTGNAAGLANEGYWGIAVSAGQAYDFSAYVRAKPGFRGPLVVAIEGTDGKVHARAEIAGLAPEWQRFTATLQSTATDPAARLVLTTQGSGTLWFNLVSLRPSGQPFRADLLRKLRDLKPAFLRFPGGTFVQGNDRASAYHWKRTIGPLVDRPGHANVPWVYWSTDHLGFHEYLLLCESLGAQPLYVAYAGMSWVPDIRSPFGVLQQHRLPVQDVPLDQMAPVVEDVLDAVEYANGPVTSPWGARRAAAGHAAPFGLKCIAVGNEDDRAPQYAERYRLIHDAIKSRFPDVHVIANAHRDNLLPVGTDLYDIHGYPRPLEAVELARRIDRRDPSTPPFALGEFAVQNTAGFGNLRAALCDAIVLGAVERNTDRIPMISYAPLLANVRAVNWTPNLIYFDNAASVGTPSYYVQKLFAESRVAEVLPVTFQAPLLPVSLHGGVATTPVGARIELDGERLQETNDGLEYVIRVRKIAGEGGVALRVGRPERDGAALVWMLGVKRMGGLVVWPMGGPQDVPVSSLETSFGGPIAPQVAGTIDPGRWYEMRLHVEQRRVRCFLDGVLVHEAVVPEDLGPSVYPSAGRTSQGGIVLRVVNASATAQPIIVNLDGGAGPRFTLETSILRADDLDAENTLDAPERVIPRRREARSVGNRFDCMLEGNSFSVLVLTPRP